MFSVVTPEKIYQVLCSARELRRVAWPLEFPPTAPPSHSRVPLSSAGVQAMGHCSARDAEKGRQVRPPRPAARVCRSGPPPRSRSRRARPPQGLWRRGQHQHDVLSASGAGSHARLPFFSGRRHCRHLFLSKWGKHHVCVCVCVCCGFPERLALPPLDNLFLLLFGTEKIPFVCDVCLLRGCLFSFALFGTFPRFEAADSFALSFFFLFFLRVAFPLCPTASLPPSVSFTCPTAELCCRCCEHHR